MRVVDTTISSHRQMSMSLQELNDGFLKRWNLLPYSMHYWYFNVIDPVNNSAASYILARSNTVITFNGQRVDPIPDVYTGVYIDFTARQTELKQTKITVADGMLQSDDLHFGIKGDKTLFRFRNNEFAFDKMLPDCYQANFWRIYEWYSLNCNRDNFYFVGNNAVIRGPLAPWNWLHFYFEDGTHIKVFSAIGQRKILQINNINLPLNAIVNNRDNIVYSAGDASCSFELTLQKGFDALLTYKPRWSPTWQYDQIGVTLQSVKTNIPDFNTQQNGTGILELAGGFSF